MNENVLKQTLEYISEVGYITSDTREKLTAFIYGNASFDIFDDKNKRELSSFYEVMKKYYMEHTNEFLPNIFYVEDSDEYAREDR